jgi:hypothetical protein
MPTHNNGYGKDALDDGHKPGDEMQLGSHGPEEVDASTGYEQSDVRVTGIVVFLVALGILVAVTGLLCFGIGKVINAHLDKEDGPTSKWTTTADIRQLGNLANNPEIQNKVAQITQQFPTPRLQLDDGYQEIADMHTKEDLLLDNYSWADKSAGKVRIPIEQAIELLAKRGLPVVPQKGQAAWMTGEEKQAPTMTPLTNGFARTGYEQDLKQDEEVEDARGKHQ